VFIWPQYGHTSFTFEKLLVLRLSSLSILTAVNLNPFPQFLQLTITTIIESAIMVILFKV
ncbi:MAG: hypothetical protein M3146_07530, partial [Thermoproteota archaeon]|nr:hypothetical protein [Thermoproteota archaeon]